MGLVFTNRLIASVAGWVIFGGILFSVLAGAGYSGLRDLAGTGFWIAGILLATRLQRLQRVQTALMLLVGVSGIVFAATLGLAADWSQILAANSALIAMLASVSFLRLISLPSASPDERDPVGPGALIRTLLGVHLFGAVINLSAVMILGDRQTRRAAMTPLQAAALSRGFALASHWSPFFAAMGIALSHAPGARLPVLSMVGLPLAVFGLAFSAWQLTRRPGIDRYIGYPMHFAALWIPALLAMVVLGTHQTVPKLPVLTVISISALTLTFMVLLWRERLAATAACTDHICRGLPTMSGELALFLAAGVLGAGIGAVIESSGWTVALAGFGAIEAWLLLLLMTGLAIGGVHPVISIATAQGVLAPLAPDPNLLGITYLMAWGVGVAISPFSGMHLGMQGRFGIDARGFLRWNGSFTLVMLLIHGLALLAYQRFALSG